LREDLAAAELGNVRVPVSEVFVAHIGLFAGV